MANSYCNLTGTNKVKDEYTKINAGFDAVEVKIEAHIDGDADKHAAEDVTYSGSFTSKTNVKDALNQAKAEIDTIVINASVDPEVALARTSSVKSEVFSTLGARLEDAEQDHATHLADVAKVFINVMAPPLAPMAQATGLGAEYDDTGAINGCINYAHTQYDGGVVIMPMPSAYYKVSSKIVMYSNILLIGATGGKAYIYNDTESAEPVIEIVGTALARLENVGLKNLKIRNGTASEGAYTAGKDGIEVKYCDGFKMRGCEITEIQGAFGLSTRYSTDIWVKDNCKFYRCTYAQFYVLSECENIHVYGNTFDTCTGLTTENTYLFATGGDGTIDNYRCKNLWIKDNKFLNNPRWEGIDSHGCENIWIEDNYVLNVRTGILVALENDNILNPKLANVHILNNVVIQGTGEDGAPGITVSGDIDDTNYCLADGVDIHNNDVTGFGSSTGDLVASMHIGATNNATINNNKIKEFKGYGVIIYTNNLGFKVKNNNIKNAVAKSSTGSSTGICVRSNGNDGVIEDNTIIYDDNAKVIDRGITVSYEFSHVNARNNKNFAVSKYSSFGNFNVNKTGTPSGIIGMRGDIATDANDMPKYFCTDTVLRFSTAKASGITLTGTSASNELTIVDGDFKKILPELEIIIAGAGVAGADLTTTIIKLTNKKVWVKDNLSTDVIGATVSYTDATWVDMYA